MFCVQASTLVSNEDMFCLQVSSLVSNDEEAKAALQISNKLAEALLKYHQHKEPQQV